jgi:tetratricopeptide (TPR) repeat protein
MSADETSSSPDRRPLEERLRGVTPLARIESHEWSESDWVSSEELLDRTEAILALARGRLTYERFLRSGEGGYPAPGANGRPALPLFERAAELAHRVADRATEREALFWVGTVQQVVHRDYSAASLALEEAREMAEADGDRLVLSCVERHLGFIAFLEGMRVEAENHLEESVRLRRAIAFPAGVAMALVALAELRQDTNDPERARRLLEEAESVARAAGASGALEAIAHARRTAVPPK